VREEQYPAFDMGGDGQEAVWESPGSAVHPSFNVQRPRLRLRSSNISLQIPHDIQPPSRLASGMGFSDTVAGLVDRLKPSSKSTSFSGIGSGNQGIVSFEDDVSSLLPTCRRCTHRLSHPQLTVPSSDDRLQTDDRIPCLSSLPQLHRHGLFRKCG